MASLLVLLKANGPLVLGALGLLGYLYQRITSTKVDGLKTELSVAKEQNTDAALAQKQTDIETQIKQAEAAPVKPPVTDQEILKDIDDI